MGKPLGIWTIACNAKNFILLSRFKNKFLCTWKGCVVMYNSGLGCVSVTGKLVMDSFKSSLCEGRGGGCLPPPLPLATPLLLSQQLCYSCNVKEPWCFFLSLMVANSPLLCMARAPFVSHEIDVVIELSFMLLCHLWRLISSWQHKWWIKCSVA